MKGVDGEAAEWDAGEVSSLVGRCSASGEQSVQSIEESDLGHVALSTMLCGQPQGVGLLDGRT